MSAFRVVSPYFHYFLLYFFLKLMNFTHAQRPSTKLFQPLIWEGGVFEETRQLEKPRIRHLISRTAIRQIARLHFKLPHAYRLCL